VQSDKVFFLELLRKASIEHGVSILYYVLMDNHYHLVLRQDTGSISHFMQFVNQGYSRHYNYRNQRSGAVYGKRFTDFFVEDQRYLEQLMLYIANNPVKAGIAKSPSRYRWSAHFEILSKAKSRYQLVAKPVLFEILGFTVEEGLKRYLQIFNDNGAYLEKLSGPDAESLQLLFEG